MNTMFETIDGKEYKIEPPIPMKIIIERVIMSGHGPKFTYCLKSDGKILFAANPGQYMAWTKKKDAQRIIDAINTHGLEYVEQKLDRKALK